jgi:DNA-3-methyladenine glycosylase II
MPVGENNLFCPITIKQASLLLGKKDPVMKDLIKRVGHFQLQPERNRYKTLVRSILSQQISVSAARSIRRKLELHLKPRRISPKSLHTLTIEDLRKVGCSNQKATYILELTRHVITRQLPLHKLHDMEDLLIIEHLTAVKGIGVWTAQMFMMFTLGRLNVFPIDDLGIVKAMGTLYGYADRPSKKDCLAIAQNWEPYASVASMYLWRHADMKSGYTAEPEKGYPV